jgi:hypothetical protein
MDEEIRHKLITLNIVMLQEELDSRNSVKGGKTFYEDAAAKFNDVNFMLESMSLPHLHADFAISQKLYLPVDKIDPEDVKKRFTDCCNKLMNVKNAWDRSGSGKVMATAADGDE